MYLGLGSPSREQRNLTLPTVTESMQTSPGTYSPDQKLDTGRQSLAMQEVKVSAQAFAKQLNSLTRA